MYKEIQKFKTGKKIPVTYDIIGMNQTVTINEEEYRADLGVLINDFIEHKTKPFWKRKYYDNHLTELYMKFFNQIDLSIKF
jgi:hypothetical protein